MSSLVQILQCSKITIDEGQKNKNVTNLLCRHDFKPTLVYFLIIPQMKYQTKPHPAKHKTLSLGTSLKKPLGILFMLQKHDGDKYDCSYLPLICPFISAPSCLPCQFQPPQAAIYKHVVSLIVFLLQLFPSSL